ncbi:hypothetical protein HPB47_023513 [Ixodes persulcatus]|uniref:Uncharacterized protein n=1 Tax=Ixodes persulcatus TaxID=34615 RepID=A0AC60Q6U4_IXOPE|nr:hypothetical protein HPB47_023513 [Ixodes persulcatus]
MLVVMKPSSRRTICNWLVGSELRSAASHRFSAGKGEGRKEGQAQNIREWVALELQQMQDGGFESDTLGHGVAVRASAVAPSSTHRFDVLDVDAAEYGHRPAFAAIAVISTGQTSRSTADDVDAGGGAMFVGDETSRSSRARANVSAVGETEEQRQFQRPATPWRCVSGH